ncbi:hypothetical protein NLJ89_g9238 [Agrocybe chaxingu]|uniref:Tyrosine specific protein phosphatases domain-containing protein n=1 Tax=Agrocybe chaxingu TaxID=84603 RepID=A0A9W8JTX0_9AGAR|nr:hypothetical protein NLJ89_g9238 [Agrocybe chaxingu]
MPSSHPAQQHPPCSRYPHCFTLDRDARLQPAAPLSSARPLLSPSWQSTFRTRSSITDALQAAINTGIASPPPQPEPAFLATLVPDNKLSLSLSMTTVPLPLSFQKLQSNDPAYNNPSSFTIGNLLLSSCPGKKVRLDGPVKGRSGVCRDLQTDMMRMKHLGVECIVCCLDDSELEFLVDLINRYTLRGIPILVHCRGGVGRAGVIACCWMIRLGLCGWVEDGPKSQNAAMMDDVADTANPNPSPETVAFVERVISLVRRRRSLKAVETYEQVQFLVDYVDHLRQRWQGKIMSVAKSNLKAAREALSKKDYANAKKHASQVLDFEPDNYNGHVFLGLALLELGENDESEQIYRKAIELNPTQPLAWQGITSFYERTGNWEKQADASIQLMNVFDEAQDAIKCAETLQKLIALYRKHGTQQQLISGLSYYLPESKLYPLLSTLPLPDPTNPTGTTTFDAQDSIHNGFRVLEEIVSLTERLEEDTFKREVERRRTRLGASSPEQIRKEVFREISGKSQLPSLYNAILNHPKTSDELRAEIDAKQLRHKQQYLASIPLTKETASLKLQILNELDELVEGIVLLRKPDELGWKLFFERKDCEDMSGYDHEHVRQYITLFPETPLASLFKGYFAYWQETLVGDEDLYTILDEDPLDTVMNAYASLSDTLVGNRFMSKVHLAEVDYENAIKTSKRGLCILQQSEAETGKTLLKTRTGFQVVLATSLVHFFSPKHHQEATRVIDEILSRSPDSTAALMGQAFILQAVPKWQEASERFDRVATLLPDDLDVGLRAQEEDAWCRCQIGRVEEGLEGLQRVSDVLDDIDDEGRNSDRARCIWRIGQCKLRTEEGPSAYKYFINALRKHPEFAPAFTSLGIYYLEHASPPDPIRSSKCFQKAFELDARETIAARRLAEGFANDREWDLVEVVAQRTIEGEGGLNAGLEKSELDAASRYLPTNSWAWKAIGIVKFHYKDYPAAIQAIQIALRVEPEDQSLWVRLGEAYNKAGRHVAALKALNRALQLDPNDWLCSYFIADVKHCMCLFEEAIQILDTIRVSHQDEVCTLVSLAQAHVDLGATEVADGFQQRAEQSFLSAIDIALEIVQRISGFRTIAWKLIADATFHLSSFPVFTNEARVRATLQAIPFMIPPDSVMQLVKEIPLPQFQNDGPITSIDVVATAIHCYLSQISLYPIGQSPSSGAWYDLAVAVRSWTAKAPSTVDTSRVQELAVGYIKKALADDPGNDACWVALGNAYFLSHPKAAQHAYIMAIEIDSKNASTWANLGLLYYHHGDVELANEALYRGQVLDPDNTLAWVGQFLIAAGNGDQVDAGLLLEHAVRLPKPVPEADYEYAFQTFNSTSKPQRSGRSLDSLLPSFFLLNRYCQRRPDDASGLHLLSLVCERLGHQPLGEKLVERAISILETAYEETEDPLTEKKYTIANSTLGRLKLAQGDFEGCTTSFESVLGLLAEKDHDAEVTTLKIQAHLGLGLAHFFQNDLETALGHLEEGFACAGDNQTLRGQITIILAQTLWAIGTDETKELAKSRLLECIASDPENLTAINTLAGMGILTQDDSLVDAALSEILALPIDQKHKLDPQRHVDYLLIQHHLAQEDTKQAISIAQHAVRTEPERLDQRNRLAALIMREGQNKDALALLAAANGMTAGDNTGPEAEDAIATLSIQAVAQCSLGDNEENNADSDAFLWDALSKAQRAIMMHPSDARGWQTLAYVRARMT